MSLQGRGDDVSLLIMTRHLKSDCASFERFRVSMQGDLCAQIANFA